MFAVIFIDMLNPYEHEDAEPLKEAVRERIDAFHELRELAHGREDAFLLYVNDNYADWRADREKIYRTAMNGAAPELIEPIRPPEDVPFAVKARHSVFYGTQVEYMLRHEGIERLLLAGQVTEQCILYSALDAYVRHFEITICRRCVAPIQPELGEAALRMMESNMRAHLVDAPAQAIEAAGAGAR
jgi:nicotinamidase-related amidase